MEIYAEYDKVPVYFSLFTDEKGKSFCSARFRIFKKYDTCPICKKYIKDGDILLFFTNWKLFPNIVVHEDCCNTFKTKEEAVEYIKKDYDEAMKYKHWFNPS